MVWVPTSRARPGSGVAAPVAGPVLLPAIAVNGKAVRGAIGADGRIPYLLAARSLLTDRAMCTRSRPDARTAGGTGNTGVILGSESQWSQNGPRRQPHTDCVVAVDA